MRNIVINLRWTVTRTRSKAMSQKMVRRTNLKMENGMMTRNSVGLRMSKMSPAKVKRKRLPLGFLLLLLLL